MSVRSEVIRIFNELAGAGKKITQLPDVTTPLAGTELLEIVQDGANKKVTASSLSSGGTGVQTIVAGTNISVDDTDPQNPIVSSLGGGGAVDSVNGETGIVVLSASDVGADVAGSAATVQVNLDTHISDSTAAHAASAISNAPSGTISSTTVQAAIDELAGDIAGITIADASETVKGIIEIATQAETNTGTDDVRAITPLKAATRYAPLASPALTGSPTAPTAAPGTNTTQVATTAFVQAQLTNVGGLLYLYNNFS